MDVRVIKNIEVNVNGVITDDEIAIYMEQLQAKKKQKITRADVTVDGDCVDIRYVFEKVPFERIRRITGYLVGTTERWNNAKQAELSDRVRHC